MGRASFVALLLWAAGCAQVFGLDETSRPPDASIPPEMIALSIDRISIGKVVTSAPQDLTGFTAKMLVTDPEAPGGITATPLAITQPGTWSIESQAMAPIEFDLPDPPIPLLRLVDFPYRHITLPFAFFENANHVAAPANAMITVDVALDSPHANESYQLMSIGATTNVGLAAPVAGAAQLAPPAYLYAAGGSPHGRYDKITTDDVVMILRYRGNALVGHLVAPPFTQTGNDRISGTLTATPQNQTLDIRVDQTQLANRIASVRPAVGAPSMTWVLRAAPGFDYGTDYGPLLEARGVLPADPQTITVPYGNPFSQLWRTQLFWTAQSVRSVAIPQTTLSAPLYAGLYELHPPSPGLVLSLPAGMPDRITVNGTPLTTDNLTVPLPNAPIEVAFVTDRPTNTLYFAQLYELVPNAPMAPTAYTHKLVVSAIMGQPRVLLPREHFQPGKYYTIRAITVQGGFPQIANGDFVTRQLPIAQGYLDSGMFQISP